MKNLLLILALACSALLSGQTVYVDLNATGDAPDGSFSNPYSDIPQAVAAAAFVDGNPGEVLVKGGTYLLPRSIKITTAAPRLDSVIIKPVPGESVTFNFDVRSAFDIQDGSSYITLQGFEINGMVGELNDFWCVVAEDLYGEFGNPQGGGLAVIADGLHINVLDNYIHDCYQKGVEIADGRYVRVKGNIIQNIAQYSLSGGHGIMRQQAGNNEYNDPDDPNFYRWDIYGNLIFNVEQRIYSWVPRKGFMEMVIDEGKSILIDDPKQTDGILDQMKARIKNNVVAFGAVDHIRLKSTPGLEVSNNSIFSEGANGDGITDKVSDDNPNGPNTLFTNFKAHGNVAQTVAGIFAIEMDHCIGESYGTGNDPMGNTPPGVITDNYAAVGRYKPRNEPNVGIFDAGTTQLFVNPTQGDFTINPAAGLPAGVGVDPAILTELSNRATAFGVNIAWDGWITDNLKLSQTILDNIPGVNDGVPGNELVFTDAGVMDANYEHIDYDVVNGSWKAARNATSTMRFELNPTYHAWYEQTITTHLNSAGEEYARVRYGDSEVKQDQVFVEDWLTASVISANGSTLINGYDNDFVLDGDLLVTFDGVTPSVGDSWDLMTAGSIAAAGTDLFDRVIFAGATPPSYTLEVVNVSGGQALRLTITELLPVELLSFVGEKIGKTNHLLTWTTTNERDNDFFAVQRSATGEEWATIGRVAAATAGTGLNRYTFTDSAPVVGSNYYRLRQVDLDGTASFSNVIELTAGANAAALSVSPNPFTTELRVAAGEDLRQLAVYDAAGRNLTNQLTIEREGGELRVRTEGLPAGTYLIRYNDKSTVVLKH